MATNGFVPIDPLCKVVLEVSEVGARVMVKLRVRDKRGELVETPLTDEMMRLLAYHSSLYYNQNTGAEHLMPRGMAPAYRAKTSEERPAATPPQAPPASPPTQVRVRARPAATPVQQPLPLPEPPPTPKPQSVRIRVRPQV